MSPPARRPRLDVRLRSEPALDAALETARQRAERPGMPVSRSAIVRALLWQALAAQGLVPAETQPERAA